MSEPLYKRIKDWIVTITAFRSGDVIPVDGPSGTAKMGKGDLLKETAQAALAGNVAPAFDETGSTTYLAGTPICRAGKTYIFKVDHSGVWSASDVLNVPQSSIYSKSDVVQRLVGNRLDDTQFTLPGRHVGEGGKVYEDSNFGDSGLCPCIPGETLYFWRDVNSNPNQFYNYVSFYDINGNFVEGHIRSDVVRAEPVPNNAYFFSVPIRYDGCNPVKIVVAGFLPNKFIPYFSSHEKISKVVDDYFVAENLFDPSATTDGSYISAISVGAEVWTSSSTYGMSDYIPVKNGLLFSWYDYESTKDKWTAQYYVTYDSNKDPIARHYIGTGKPQILILEAGAKYIRLQFTVSHKNEISVGHQKFTKFVPFGGIKPLFLPDITQSTGSDTTKVMSQKAVTDALGNAGTEPDSFSLDVTGCETDILAIARNYVLKEYEENSTRYFEFSDDCGKTFTKVENTIGQINFVHFFSTGRVLICGATKVYYTDDFSSFTETSVYDYDGTAFVANTNHFYRLGNYNSEYNEIEGQEVLVWNDYNTEEGYKSRVWFTDDYGVTLKCILKDDETVDSDGNLIEVSHFHRTFLDNETGKLWVTSGDYSTLCKLIVGTRTNGVWSYDVINKGELYKLTQFIVKKPYAFFITDYTNGVDITGIAACPLDGLDDPDNFRYIYKTDNNEALSKYFEDDNGYRLIFPDGIGTRAFWFANGNFDFKKLSIIGGSGRIVLDNVYGPSYGGAVVCLSHTNGYSSAVNPSMSGYARYDLAKMMKSAGFKNFGKIRKFFERLQ